MKSIITKIRNTHGIESLNSYCSELGDDIQQLMLLSENEFDKGFVSACAITLVNHNEPVIVADTFKANFMTVEEMQKKGIEQQDINILKPIIESILNGIKQQSQDLDNEENLNTETNVHGKLDTWAKTF
jgi:hypothetical protein